MNFIPPPRPRALPGSHQLTVLEGPSTQLWSLPNLESLGPPAYRQALSLAPFPNPVKCQGGATPQDCGGPLLHQGPSVARPAAQSGVLLTSWVWRAAARRRGLGEAAGRGPGWDIVGEAAAGAASGKRQRNCTGGLGQSVGREGQGGAVSEAAFPTQP